MSSHGTAHAACNGLNELANGARCAMPATSASLVRALQAIQNRIPPELSPHEPLSALKSRFTGSLRVCSIDALRTVGVPDEILELACTEEHLPFDGIDPLPGCGCSGLAGAFDPALLEDPDNRPFIWDMEEECP